MHVELKLWQLFKRKKENRLSIWHLCDLSEFHFTARVYQVIAIFTLLLTRNKELILMFWKVEVQIKVSNFVGIVYLYYLIWLISYQQMSKNRFFSRDKCKHCK